MITPFSITEKLIVVSILLLSSISLRIGLEYFNQNWIKTKSHTYTIILLPLITYVITSVISGNIALSLGMVGALSIVRFRNPVRSPLELSTYFAVITMGVAASVSIKWQIFLILIIIFSLAILEIINFVCKYFFKYELYSISFSEGNNLSTLVIVSPEIIDLCEKNKLLQSKIASNNDITYLLASEDFSKLKMIEENKEVQKKKKSIEIKR